MHVLQDISTYVLVSINNSLNIQLNAHNTTTKVITLVNHKAHKIKS